MSIASVMTHKLIGKIQRRLAWPLRKDDTQKSRTIQLNLFFLLCIFMKYSIVVCTTIHYIVLLLPTLLAPFLPIFFVVAFASWNLLPVDSLCILTSFFHHCCSRIVLLFAASNHLLLLLLVQRRL